MAADQRTIVGIQYLRFFAALLVILDHSFQTVGQAGRGQLSTGFAGGAAGVDVFFVISGFIMTHISQRPDLHAGRFMLDRLTRIAPPYWLLTLVIAAVLLIKPALFSSVHFTVPIFLSSLAFLAWPNPWLPGNPPLLQIGWTLNYEIFFYVIFALAMFTSRRHRVVIAISTITILAAIGIFSPSRNAWVEFYTFPMILEFAFGMMIAAYTERRTLPAFIATPLLLVGITLLLASLAIPLGRMSAIRTLIWGVPAALTVLGMVALEQQRQMIKSAGLLLLGNASYSLYLTHMLVLGAIRATWHRLDRLQLHDALLLSLCVVSSILVGIAFYYAVERPLIKKARVALGLGSKGRKPATPSC